MALNVKAAMMICAGCIGGMSWLMHGMDVRQVEVPSPLVAGEPQRLTLVADVQPAPPPPAPLKDRRSSVAQQFAHASPVEAETREAHAKKRALAVIAPAESVVAELPPLLLPPRASTELGGADVRLAAYEEPVPNVEQPAPVPDEAATSPAVALQETPTEPAKTAEPEFREYQVVRGDSLWRIAQRAYGSRDPRYVALLQEANPQVRARDGQVNVGETIRLPGEAKAEHMLAALAEAKAVAAANKTAKARWYTIRRDDSLIRIARRHLQDGKRWREIVELNRPLDPKRIYPGMKIKLPPVIRVARG